MNEREFKNLKARIAYREKKKNEPKCDDCEECLIVTHRGLKQRLCIDQRTLIENTIETCPKWCPKRQ